MKTAISVPDDIFEEAERFAHRHKRSRSQLYSAALAEYLARHSPDEVTSTMNSVIEQIGGEPTDEFGHAAAKQTILRSEW